jgi:putative SOS response-associated peptidase YedK
MCGRVKLVSDWSEIKIQFGLWDKLAAPNFPARWNGAPTQDFPILRYDAEHGVRTAGTMRWGLVPSWSKDDKPGYATFNAKCETLASKPAFRAAWKAARRCIVPLDGFYEWEKIPGGKKQPHLISRADGKLMAVAGLWEPRHTDSGESLSFTIITTEANRLMSTLHDRMPVILSPEHVSTWLGEGSITVEDAAGLMKPCADDWLTTVQVDPRMSNVKNWGAEFCQPLKATAA